MSLFNPYLLDKCDQPNQLVPRELQDNLKFRRELKAWIDDEGEIAEKMLADWCRRDVLFFADALVCTLDPKRHPGAPLRPWITLPFQKEALWTIDEAMGSAASVDDEMDQAAHDMSILKSRDMGCSIMALIAVDRRFLLFDQQVFVFISSSEELVDKKSNPNSMFPKIDIIHSELPSFMVQGVQRTKLQFSIPERMCVMDGMATTGNVSRSGRPHAIIPDEFAAWPVNASLDFLAASAGASNCRLFISTAQGRGNGFHQVVQNKDIPCLRLHWVDHPWHSAGLYWSKGPGGAIEFRDKEFWETTTFSWLRRKYPLVARRVKDVEGDPLLRDVYPFFKDGKHRSPYYDYEWIRAPFPWIVSQELDLDFVGSGSPFYDHARIQTIIDKESRVAFTRGSLAYDAFNFEPGGFVEQDGGSLELWINLVQRLGKMVPPQRAYRIGVDVSAGTGASNSCISVWDCLTHEKICVLTRSDLRPERLAEYAYAMWKWFHEPEAVIAEGQGHGKDFLRRLRELGCNRLFHMEKYERGRHIRSEQPGLFIEGTAKNSLLIELGRALVDGEAVIRDRESLGEALQFELGADGKAEHVAAKGAKNPGGAKKNHGDRWMADCLAWYLVKRWKNVDRNKLEEHITQHEPTQTEIWMAQEDAKHGRSSWGAKSIPITVSRN